MTYKDTIKNKRLQQYFFEDGIEDHDEMLDEDSIDEVEE